MFSKLEEVKKRYEEINQQLSDPNITSNQAVYSSLMKESKNILPIVEKYDEYKGAEKQIRDAEELLNTESDNELRQMAKEELESAKGAIIKFEEELKILLLPKDPNDDKNVIMEIRAGAGGDEAALFAAELYRMYSMYAEGKNWAVEIMDQNESGIGGFKEIVFMITGGGAYSKLKFESGVHRVQRVPATEASGRIHTSTATVAVMPEVEELEVNIRDEDLKIDTYRASGAGGQHVNKTESAIRITHLPSGIVVTCQDESSQIKNRDKALKLIRAKVYDMELEKKTQAEALQRKTQVGTGDRSEKIRTYNFPQTRLTDHRINLTLYKLDYIMDGELDELLDSLITYDQAEKLKSSK